MTRPRTVAPRSSSCAESPPRRSLRRSTARSTSRALIAAGYLAFVGWLPAGCEDSVATVDLVDRSHRFGIFRDLVLFNRPESDGGPFFLDRFEATRPGFAAWREWQLAKKGIPQASPRPGWVLENWPQGAVDLYAARSFARWRFCRVPGADEWRYAFTEGGTYEFPWSDTLRDSDTLANTGRLSLGRTTRVGSFASGAARATGPFDLVGNVAEWTETVADENNDGTPIPFVHEVEAIVEVRRVVGLPEWPDFQTPEAPSLPWERSGAMPLGLRVWLPLWTPMPSEWLERGRFDYTESRYESRVIKSLYMPGVHAFRQTPGLNSWLPSWSPVPTDWLVAAETHQLERLVLGGHYRTRDDPSALYRHPGDRDPTIGVRVAADPAGLLAALLAYAEPMPSVAAQNTLRRFLRRTAHRQAFLRVWPHVVSRVSGDSTLRGLLTAEFGYE